MLLVLSLISFICVGLIVYNWKNLGNEEGIGGSEAFKKFQLVYLSTYLCMSMSDWLQGAYVYVLYESYGYSIDLISKLFILGFFSSMLFGTIVGSLSDRM